MKKNLAYYILSILSVLAVNVHAQEVKGNGFKLTGLTDKDLFQLGHQYFYGNGVSRDIDKSVQYLTLAAEKGNVPAIKFLGLTYVHFKDSVVDNNLNYQYSITRYKERALALYQKEGESGELDSQRFLGMFYKYEDKDVPKSLYWLNKAAKQGNVRDKYELMEACLKVPESHDLGERMLKEIEVEVTLQGNTENIGVVNRVAQIYLYGNNYNIKTDYEKAFWLFSYGDKFGDAPSQYNLGLMYLNGAFVKQDFQKAYAYMAKTLNSGSRFAFTYREDIMKAAQGDADSLWLIVSSGFLGMLIPEDMRELQRMKYIRLAAKQGSVQAQQYIKMLMEQGRK